VGATLEEVVEALRRLRSRDPDPRSGRLLAHSYETGDEGVRRVAAEALTLFQDTNALNPLVFRSALELERRVVGFVARLVGAPEGYAGTWTYGGTESIALAVLAARERFARARGRSAVGEVVAPATAHPAVRKAAWLLGLRVREVPVEPGSFKADVEAVKEALGPSTALVFLSAPNYPFGTVDPVRDVAEAAADAGVPVHVDACIGGFILPFLAKLGWRVEAFGFEVEGVASVSVDVHKYGYSPKGASVVLFREPEMRKHTLFVDVAWPGYPFVNTTLLSSRSIGPLAAAWAVISYLGEEGYLEKARMVSEAARAMAEGLSRLGLKPLAPIESPVFAVASEEGERATASFYAAMALRGWIMGVQPAVPGLSPLNIHLTVAPVHAGVYREFLEDAEAAARGPEPPEALEVYRMVEEDPLRAAGEIASHRLGGLIAALLISRMPRAEAAEAARELAAEVFS
jgi:glutamate/tyrosine decarboxylase-like PLP-dependent enzyme